MSLLLQDAGADPVLNYHLLRSALDLYGRRPGELDGQKYQNIRVRATRSYRLESRVLGSVEARGLVVPDDQLRCAVDAVAARYADASDFEADLVANGLDRQSLSDALRRELMFDAVMQRVAANAADVTDIDIQLFYEIHHDRFRTPELRTARHILVTINPDFADNTPLAARARIEGVAKKLRGRRQRFEDLAKRYSECPTALNDGMLGELRRGALYPQLDAVLFGMLEGEVSEVIESEIGFHILYCEQITPGTRIPLAQAEEKIRGILEERHRRYCQKAWLATLGHQPAASLAASPTLNGRACRRARAAHETVSRE